MRARGSATPAVRALLDAGVEHRVHRYDHDDRHPSYGEEAVSALGVEPGRIFKTLVARIDRALVVAVVPVPARLDLKALAAVVGAKSAEMADPRDAERATGYVVGGISPLGQRRRLDTVVDASAAAWATIFVSGGRRGLEIELTAADLVAATGGRLASVAVDR